MAKGDVSSTNTRSRGRSGGSSYNYHYDDEGRGSSKSIWEWFESNYDIHNYETSWLMGLEDERCFSLLKNSVTRFGLMDIAFQHNANLDSRARRLVIKKSNKATWNAFHEHMVDGYKRYHERLRQHEVEQAAERDKQYATYRAQREAEQARIRREDWEQVSKTLELTTGMFTSEFNQAFDDVDRSDALAGDWIDDPAAIFIHGDGYGYEDRKAVGTKLQITLSLDLSNSMYYNSIADIAANAYRDLGMTLKQLSQEHEGELFTAFFTFSLDTYDFKGRRAQRIYRSSAPADEYDMQEFTPYSPKNLATSWELSSMFNGEDTWISPLFEQIEDWEHEHSDSGAAKLDIIITDAVLEHPKDIRDADVIQERRDGQLQTVLLNFMPEAEWLGSTLPKRCFMVAVDKDNVAGILRNVLSEFLGAQV